MKKSLILALVVALSIIVSFGSCGKKIGGEITIVEPSVSMFIDTIQVRGNVGFMTIDRQENTLFVTLPDKRTLQKINLTSKKTAAEIDVGDGAYAVVVVGES